MLEVSIEDNTPQAYQLDYSKQHMLIDVGWVAHFLSCRFSSRQCKLDDLQTGHEKQKLYVSEVTNAQTQWMSFYGSIIQYLLISFVS